MTKTWGEKGFGLSMLARSVRSTFASSSRLQLNSVLPGNALNRLQQPTNVFSNKYKARAFSSKARKTSVISEGIEEESDVNEEPSERVSSEERRDDEQDILNRGAPKWYSKDANLVNVVDEKSKPFAISESTLGTIGENFEEIKRTLARQEKDNLTIKQQKLVDSVISDPRNNAFPHTPKITTWDKVFYKENGINTRHRMFISNVETAKKVVDALKLEEQQQAAGERITVIEGYPGIGSLSQQLCRHESVEKVIAFEDHASFNKTLRNLRDVDEKVFKKLDVVPLTCFQWDSYDQLVNLGFLDNMSSVRENRNKTPNFKDGIFSNELWKKPSPLLFLAQLPNTVHSEQLVSQLLRSISSRYWLYRYTRVRMAFICSHQMAMRCLAKTSERLYGKLTLVAGASANSTIALGPSHFQPYANHFWPSKPTIGPQTPQTVFQGSLKDHRLQPTPAKQDQCLLILEPKEKPLLEGNSELESFDFITKNLFILRSSTVKKALTHIAPGAANILDAMNSGRHPAMMEIGNVTIDPKTIVYDLTLSQIIGLSKMFERWPFRPGHLFDQGRIEEFYDMNKK